MVENVAVPIPTSSSSIILSTSNKKKKCIYYPVYKVLQIQPPKKSTYIFLESLLQKVSTLNRTGNMCIVITCPYYFSKDSIYTYLQQQAQRRLRFSTSTASLGKLYVFVVSEFPSVEIADTLPHGLGTLAKHIGRLLAT